MTSVVVALAEAGGEGWYDVLTGERRTVPGILFLAQTTILGGPLGRAAPRLFGRFFYIPMSDNSVAEGKRIEKLLNEAAPWHGFY